jgi:outer membrane protein assembly factor BamB
MWIESSPAVANGVVYIGSNNGYIYALNAASGIQLWNYSTSNPVWSSPAVVNGVVYIGSTDGNVYALRVSPTSTSTPTSPATIPIATIAAVTGAGVIVVAAGLVVYFKFFQTRAL